MVVKRLCRWKIRWDGTVVAQITKTRVHVAEEPRKQISFRVWSPTERAFDLREVSMTVGGSALKAEPKRVAVGKWNCSARLPRTLHYGDSLEEVIQYRCVGYYPRPPRRIQDEFTVGLPTYEWSYDFILPEHSRLVQCHLHRLNGKRPIPQHFESDMDGDCPVIRYARKEPPIDSRLRVEFQLRRLRRGDLEKGASS